MPVYMLAFIIAAGVALLVTPGVICLAGKTGAMDAPDARKVHKKPIPRIGGIGIYVDPASLPLVDGTQIDFIKQGLNEQFVFRNPNVAGECGCGESFTTDADKAA